MTAGEENYRRLPGRLRGIASSASLWMASDHILLVKSSWFREEYKRFYLRDIQAIVVARCARFHVSLLVFIFALMWVFVGFGVSIWPASVGVVWGLGGLAMGITWLSISMASSCRCRLYTAVSRDDLPSLYRTWTAHKFLSQVKPRIDQVQGTVDPAWAEAERSNAGPSVAPTLAADMIVPVVAVPGQTLASALFVLSLLVGALGDFGNAHFNSAAWLRLTTALALAQIVGAIAVMIEYRRGKLRRGMQGLALAALSLIGVMFYVQSLALSFTAAAQSAPPGVTIPIILPFAFLHRIAGGLRALLGLIGVAILLRDRADGRIS